MNTRRQKTRRLLLLAFFLLLPITLNYYSPALMTQGTAERVASFSLFTWSAIFLSSLVLGRAFCGYACPFHGLQMVAERVGVRPTKRVRVLHVTKYVLWGFWVSAVVAFAVATGGWQRIDLLYLTEHVVSIDSPMNLVVYYALVGITLAPLGLGKRGFCHYFCPFGVWSIVGTRLSSLMRLPRLRLRAEPGACTECGRCDRVCPMSLPVSSMVASGSIDATECVLCGSCVDECPRDAIRYGFGR